MLRHHHVTQVPQFNMFTNQIHNCHSSQISKNLFAKSWYWLIVNITSFETRFILQNNFMNYLRIVFHFEIWSVRTINYFISFFLIISIYKFSSFNAFYLEIIHEKFELHRGRYLYISSKPYLVFMFFSVLRLDLEW